MEAPALAPIKVTDRGLPPKFCMLRFTHCKDTRTSLRPKLPDATSFPVLKKPLKIKFILIHCKRVIFFELRCEK